MFQFPRFASSPYVFRTGYPRKGGFPHSDIRGSTIARISPRLFAACHVLHRLLAPRHPPNALISLHIHTTARAQGQITPHTITLLTDSSASHHISAQTNTLTLVMRHNTPIHLHHEKEQHLKPAPQPPSRNQSTKQDRFFWKPGKLIARKPQPSPMETVGFEPTTPCLQSRCSPTELRPLRGNSQLSTRRDKIHTGISHIRPA